MGKKTGKVLAQRLQREKSSTIIQAIKSNATIMRDPKGIIEQFKEFYEDLCKSQTSATDHDLDHFFKEIDLPILPQVQKGKLDDDITKAEMIKAILQVMKNMPE